MEEFNHLNEDMPRDVTPNVTPDVTHTEAPEVIPEITPETTPEPDFVPKTESWAQLPTNTPPVPNSYNNYNYQRDFANRPVSNTTQFEYPQAQVRPNTTKRKATPRQDSYMPTSIDQSRGSRLGPIVITALFATLLGIGGGMLINQRLPRKIAETIVDTTSDRQVEVPTLTRTIDDSTPVNVAAKALPSVVSIHTSSGYMEGLGSGVVLNRDGDIITNYHVVEDVATIGVTIGTNTYTATLVGADPSSDIAVIKLDEEAPLTPIEIGNSDELQAGSWVMTIGSPFGLDQSVSAGIVSAISRNTLMPSTSGNTVYANLIQTDATINPGNSGGALVNADGKLVGIATLFSSDTESFAGIGFAIPGNYAIEIANKIIAGEDITHAYIGLSMQTVTDTVAKKLGLSTTYGAYVAEVNANSPAEKAGMKAGDIVIGIDDTKIESADDVILTVRTYKVGDTAKITFMRGSKEMTVDVTFSDDSALQQQQREQNAFRDQEPIRDYDKQENKDDFYDYLTPEEEDYYYDDPLNENWDIDKFFDYIMEHKDQLM